MKFRVTSLLYCGLPVLLGGGSLLGSAPAARAGEPIQFSSPAKEVEAPVSPKDFHNLPRPTLRWDLRSPEISAPPPVVIPLLDPRTQRKLREQREENKTWPFNQPALFKDKEPERIQNGKTAVEEAFGSWDENVARVLGRPALPGAKDNRGNPLAGPLSSSEPLFERTGKGGDPTKPAGSLAAKDTADEGVSPNSSEAAVKALFETKPKGEKLPVLPGMSLREIFGASEPSEKTLRLEREARREEFNRILSPQERGPATAGKGPENAADQTRALMNPVTPATVENALAPKGRFDLAAPLPNPADKLGHPKLPFEEVVTRYQPAASVKPAENKTRQLEALKLTTRPSVLSFPGRQF